MSIKQFYWDVFEQSGDLNAYITYKELEKIEENNFEA